MSLLDNTIDAKEAATLIGCSVQFIRMRLRDGRLPHLRVGSRYHIEKQDVLNLIERSKPHNDPNVSLE